MFSATSTNNKSQGGGTLRGFSGGKITNKNCVISAASYRSYSKLFVYGSEIGLSEDSNTLLFLSDKSVIL